MFWEVGLLVWVWDFTDPHSQELQAAAVLISHHQSQHPVSCSAHLAPLLCGPEPRPGAGRAVRLGWSVEWGWAVGQDGQWGKIGNGMEVRNWMELAMAQGWAMGWVGKWGGDGQWGRMDSGVSWTAEWRLAVVCNG